LYKTLQKILASFKQTDQYGKGAKPERITPEQKKKPLCILLAHYTFIHMHQNATIQMADKALERKFMTLSLGNTTAPLFHLRETKTTPALPAWKFSKWLHRKSSLRMQWKSPQAQKDTTIRPSFTSSLPEQPTSLLSNPPKVAQLQEHIHFCRWNKHIPKHAQNQNTRC
jgi:hypothetical protein